MPPPAAAVTAAAAVAAAAAVTAAAAAAFPFAIDPRRRCLLAYLCIMLRSPDGAASSTVAADPPPLPGIAGRKLGCCALPPCSRGRLAGWLGSEKEAEVVDVASELFVLEEDLGGGCAKGSVRQGIGGKRLSTAYGIGR
jgi:hypothetical protein